MIMGRMIFNKSKPTLAEAEMLPMVHLSVQVSVLDGTSTPNSPQESVSQLKTDSETILVFKYKSELCSLVFVVHALITSLDYCKMFKTLNISISIKCCIKSIAWNWTIRTPISLLWSSLVPNYIWFQFKMLVLTYKTLHGLGPPYMSKCFFPCSDPHCM